MPTVGVSGVSEHEKEWFDKMIEDKDMSRAEWMRYCMRAGMRLWDGSGNFDVTEMQEPFESTKSTSSTTDKQSGGNQLKNILLNNLSTDDPLSREEVNSLLTEKAIGEALAQLRDEGKIEYDDRRGGYVKK